MDISSLMDYINLLILGICLCIGYILKHVVPEKAINRYIPLISGILGISISIWNFGTFNPQTVLTGLISGLASTGVYESFRNLIGGLKDND